MEAKEIRALTCDGSDNWKVGGTGDEETLRNLLLREIAAQLAELNDFLRHRWG